MVFSGWFVPVEASYGGSHTRWNLRQGSILVGGWVADVEEACEAVIVIENVEDEEEAITDSFKLRHTLVGGAR